MAMTIIGTDKRMRMMRAIFPFVAAFICMLQFSCAPESKLLDDDAQRECRLNFNVTKKGYNGTNLKATTSEQWKDGDCVYLSFINGAERISGKAVYHSSDAYWTLTYDGQLPLGTTCKCCAFFFEGAQTETATAIALSEKSCVYADLNGTYNKNADVVNVSACLTPQSGRIRFAGEKGFSCRVSGALNFESYTKSTATLKTSGSGIACSIADNGYSDYYYLSFENDSRTLCVAYDRYSFKTICEHPILDASQSGYMALPTKDSHNGWTMIEMNAPTVDLTTVTNVGVTKASLQSSLKNNGNGTITDCGFCYSKATNPTVADMKVSYGKSSSDFGCSITNLSENTTYYVRSYAINEIGVGYGPETSFKTQAVTTPELSSVTISNISNTTVNLEAIVTSYGNGTLTDAGFVYSTNPYPTTSSTKISCGKVTSLKTIARNLQPETQYYVRAYAINEKGTNYGEEKTFTTAKIFVNPYTTLKLETSYGSTTLDMAKIDGGTFTMGAQKSSSSQSNYDNQAYSDEAPTHSVTLTSYYIGKTEITQKQWYVVMGSYPNISSAYGLGDDYPVYNVTYDQCIQFISKLKTLTGKNFRLPTEAEWEYAARGGQNLSDYKYSGSSTIGNVAWYSANSSSKTHVVATKNANDLKLYDMTGNVWEWCSDWYGNYSSSSQNNPKGPASGSSRVIRGGGCEDATIDSRVSVRSSAVNSFKSQSLGLRVVME